MDEAERRLKKRVDDILEETEDIDLAEDDLYGEDSRGDELPEELADPVKRIKKDSRAQREYRKRRERKDRRSKRQTKGQRAKKFNRLRQPD